MNDAIVIIIMWCCDDFHVHRFIKSVREWESAKDQGTLLQTSLGQSYLHTGNSA